MKLLALLTTLLLSTTASASGGFLWLGHFTESVGLKLEEIHIVHFLIVSSLILIFGVVYRLKTANVDKSIIPDKGITYKNIYEGFGGFIYNLAKGIMGEKEAKKFFPVLITLFFLILFSNFFGLIPGFLPPTDNINTTLACGIFVFIYYNYQGIRAQGLIGHIKHFMGPVWYMAFLIFPIEIVSHLVRPLSLGLRLAGNMTGDHTVLTIFNGLTPYGVPMIFYGIGMFVCFIQAFVFTLLTMVYIGLATEQHDHEAH